MSETTVLEPLGYTPRWRALFADFSAHADRDHLQPGRVVRADRGSVLVACAAGIVRAEPSARLLKAAGRPGGGVAAAPGAAPPGVVPVTGDWVALHAPPGLEVPLVEAVLEREGAIERGAPGETSDHQVLVANVDVVFVVEPIADEPNQRRVERELALAWESGAVPVVVLTKADLAADPSAALASVETVAIGVDVHVTSAPSGRGVAPLRSYARAHRTIALIGRSGAGKSTLVNALLGEERQATGAVRASDGRGRHVTVARELIPLPGGGVLLDTPGLRSLGLTESSSGIAAAFADVEELAAACRFNDCSHTSEPGCAVLRAVDEGELPSDRLASYHKLQREARVAAMKTDARLRAEEVRKWKIIHKSVRAHMRQTGKDGW